MFRRKKNHKLFRIVLQTGGNFVYHVFGDFGDLLVNVSEEGHLRGCIGACGGVGCPYGIKDGMGSNFLGPGPKNLRIWRWPFLLIEATRGKNRIMEYHYFAFLFIIQFTCLIH